MPIPVIDYDTEGFSPQELTQTRSSFLTDDLVVRKSGLGGAAGWGPIIVIATLFVILLAIYGGGPSKSYSLLEISVGILLLLAGWREKGRLGSLEKIPRVQIGKAPDGLGAVQGNWAPEKKFLASPLYGQKCIIYKIELQEMQHSKNGGYWVTIAEFAKGAPVLLADDTGYLAIDLANANVNFSNTGELRKLAINSEDELALSGSTQGQDLIRYVQSAPDVFDPSFVGVELSDTYKEKIHIFGGTELTVLETMVYPDNEGFAIGRILDTGKKFRGKPVKAMVYDSQSRRLSFKTGTEQTYEKRSRDWTKAYFVAGLLLLVIGLLAAHSAGVF